MWEDVRSRGLTGYLLCGRSGQADLNGCCLWEPSLAEMGGGHALLALSLTVLTVTLCFLLFAESHDTAPIFDMLMENNFQKESRINFIHTPCAHL